MISQISHTSDEYGLNLISLLNLNNIKKEDIYVIGDSSNDIEMIKDFNGVGMDNSSLEVLKIVKKTYPEVSDYLNEILKTNL